VAASPLRVVFDTAAGFSGVWHLSEERADTLDNDVYRDATQAGNHADDRIQNQGREGLLGKGHAFVDFDYLHIPNAPSALKPTTAFTLSAWVKSSLPSDTIGDIISMGDVYGLRAWGSGSVYAFFWPTGAPDTGAVPDAQSYERLAGGAPALRDATWHHVAATLSGNAFRLFLDGKVIASKTTTGPVHYDARLGKDFIIGKHGFGKTGYQFNGSLDEIQIHGRARSPEWLRIVYENQKPNAIFPALEAP
jgi:hypothetical protein